MIETPTQTFELNPLIQSNGILQYDLSNGLIKNSGGSLLRSQTFDGYERGASSVTTISSSTFSSKLYLTGPLYYTGIFDIKYNNPEIIFYLFQNSVSKVNGVYIFDITIKGRSCTLSFRELFDDSTGVTKVIHPGRTLIRCEVN